MSNEQLIAILNLLRPKAYNAITKILVLAGVSLIISTFWEQLVEVLLEAYLKDVKFPNDPVMGSILIALGLVYNISHRLIKDSVNNSYADCEQAFQFLQDKKLIPALRELSTTCKNNNRIDLSGAIRDVIGDFTWLKYYQDTEEDEELVLNNLKSVFTKQKRVKFIALKNTINKISMRINNSIDNVKID